MFQPHDPSRLVGRPVTVDVDGDRRTARVLAAGLYGVTVQSGGRSITVPASHLDRLGLSTPSTAR